MSQSDLALARPVHDVSGATSDDTLVSIWLSTHASEHTRRTYALDAAMLLAWLGERGAKLQTMTVLLFATYAQALIGAPATRRRRVASAKSLITFGRRTGYLQFDVSAAIRSPRADADLAARILSRREVESLLSAATGRLRAVLRLAYVAGLRISETLGLRWGDVHNTDDGATISVLGKGRRLRHVRVDAGTLALLGAARQPDAHVFVTRHGGPVAASQLDCELKRLSVRAIGKAVSLHWLRHSHASHALDRGAPIHLVQQTLGHASLATTGRYAHASPSESSGDYLGLGLAKSQTDSRARATA